MGYTFLIIFIAIVLITVLLIARSSKKNKQKIAQFLTEHPGAVKIYGKVSTGLTVTMLTVTEVDGIKPITGSEGKETVYYLTPGEHHVKVNYHSRINIFGGLLAMATATNEENILSVIFEPNRSYTLTYDKSTRAFFIANR